MRSFLAVVRAGSLSAAARELGVRHTTIGRHVAALEAALGGSLFVRRPDGVELTMLGEQLVPTGSELEHAMRAFGDAAFARRTRVRLAWPSGYSTLLAERIASFRAANPNIELDVTSGSKPVDLTRGEADLAVRVGRVEDEALVAVKLCTAGWSLYAADRYLARRPAPADPHILAGHEVIGFHPRLAGVAGAIWLEEHGAGATIVMHVADMSEMLDAALSGAGLAVLPCVLADAEPRMHRLTRSVLGTQPVWLVYRREIAREGRVRAVIRFVSSAIKDQSEAIGGVLP